MKILYWTERFWPHIGGIEVLSLELISALRKRGYDFTVVTSHSNAELPDEAVFRDIPIYRFHLLTSLTNRNLKQMITARKKIAELKNQIRPDLVHIHFSGPSAFFHNQTASAHPAPTLITIHSLPPSINEKSTLAIDSLRSANWLNTVAATVLPRIKTLVPELSNRISVIYNGISLPALEPTPLPFDPPRLLCLGRLVNWKGFDVALEAFATLRKKFPNLDFIIAGDGPEKEKLRRQAIQLGVGEVVKFPGWVDPDEVPALINSATMVVIPSREGGGETLPVVAQQASLMARPILASRIAGLPEIVTDQKTGFLIEPDDVNGFARGIMYLLHQPGQAAEMGNSARRVAQEKFGLARFTNSYDLLYQQLTEEFRKNRDRDSFA